MRRHQPDKAARQELLEGILRKCHLAKMQRTAS
jgi:hypothetical protein